MDYVRKLDKTKFDPTRFSVQTLAGRDTGSERCMFRVARVAPGAGNESMHIHTVDKFYYILSGAMQLIIAGERHTVGPDSLVFVPANVPHRNWNEGPEPEEHIVLFVPEVAPGEPLVIPVEG